ncbi:MAG: hypothetical protein ABSF26_11935 [Thermoguttaceae bacterium]|jgi:hypothetical protein
MRTSKKEQLLHAERKALEQKRSQESWVRKEKRREKGRAEDAAKTIQHSPAGRKAAATLKAKRGKARKEEQANYQKTMARAAARVGGRRKQIHAEFQAKVEE